MADSLLRTKLCIINFGQNTKKTAKSKQTKGFLQSRKTLLEQYWTKYVSLFEDILNDVASVTEEASKAALTMEDFSNVERAFSETIGELSDEIIKFDQPGTTSSTNDTGLEQSISVSQNQTAQLPRIPIPAFDGNYMHWNSFKDLFTSLVIKNTSLTNTQRLQYLKDALKDDAKHILDNITTTDANFAVALHILESKYENKRIIISAYIAEILNLPKLQKESAADLRNLSDKIMSAYRALEHMKRPVDQWDDWLVYAITHKLDATTRKAWELSLPSANELPTFAQLQTFLQSRTHSLEIVQTYTEPNSSKQSDLQKPKTSVSKAYHAATNRCNCCNADHFILFCSEFKNKTPHDRYAIVQNANLCLNCLRQGHRSKACGSQHRCRKCNRAHHTLLHDHFATLPVNNSNAATLYNTTTKPTQQQPLSVPSVLIGTAVVEGSGETGSRTLLRVLLDSGAESSFISEYAVNCLQLKRTPLKLAINGAGGGRVATSTGITRLTLTSLQAPFEMECVALILPKVGTATPSYTISQETVQDFSHLQLADPKFNIPGPIDMILSAADYAHILCTQIIRSDRSSIIAQRTQFGWVVFGGINGHHISCKRALKCHQASIGIEETLRKFWELEEVVGEKQPLTKNEKYCEDFFERTTTRDATGRYSVRLPVKEDCEVTLLKSSKRDALMLLNHTWRRLEQDASMKDMYSKFMSDYHELGHMEKVPKDEPDPQNMCYLPHHGVWKDSSTTTKLRVVFNAARENEFDLSLNKCLHTGPKLQNDLWAIILNWRRYQVAYSGDIEKMYRQIRIHQEDADLLRIVWKPSAIDNPTTYRLLTVTYGTNCAPYQAIKTLQRLANDEGDNYQDAATTLRNEFYVDDVLSGGEDAQEVSRKIRELQALLRTGGFPLRKFKSNSQAVIDQVAEDDNETTEYKDLNMDHGTKALGLWWQTQEDTFQYIANIDYTLTSFTKRQLLSDIARLFDPLGFLAPVVIRGKLFFQQLWTTGIEWSDKLPASLQRDWVEYRTELQRLNEVKIPRWIGISKTTQTYELHVFADASSRAYAAAAYLKVTSNSTSSINLLSAKTKVAPMKKTTIPRLELCAALLAAKLMKAIADTLQLNGTKTWCWSDSGTVLSWVRADPGNLKEFVSNRVTEIQNLTSPSWWRYVPTQDNPADQASRGTPVNDFLNNHLWWHGPDWLKRDKSYWPSIPQRSSCQIPETKVTKLLATAPVNNLLADLVEKYSTLDELLVVAAAMYRFIAACRKQPHECGKIMLWSERKHALERLILFTQGLHFSTELVALTNGKTVGKQSKICKLNPIIDTKGLLRVGGRLSQAKIDFTERYPVILPKEATLTKLVIAQSHARTLHGGTQATLQHLRRYFWVIDGRRSVKQHIHKCVPCFRQDCKPHTQIMGDLPPERCNVSFPFKHTGIDYAGPFNIRTSKGRGHRSYKGYVAVFVCLATRAIHLELVSDMTTNAFLAALKRFSSVRGLCTTLHSDRGTTFIGADSLMKAEIEAHKQQLLTGANYASKHGIEWKFIPPAAPNFGGIWEAGVKSMKFHLRRVIGTATLTFEEFYTVLKQVEACLNSRPLAALSDDPTDLTMLTPGHFLIGRAITTIEEPNLLNENISPHARFKLLTQMQQSFWKRWSQDYLMQLQGRSKWWLRQENMKVGQLVLLRDEQSPPLHWPIGRIIKIHPGEDGLVRVVTIKTAKSILKRPISKISPLPVSTDDSIEDGGRNREGLNGGSTEKIRARMSSRP